MRLAAGWNAGVERPIVAFDTETATSRGAPHLIELAALRAVEGEVLDRFESLARPDVPIDPRASDVHGLTEREVAGAPDAGEVLGRFLEWLGEDWLAAHNAPFDAGVLGFEARRHGLALPDVPILDTLRLARRWIPESPDHTLSTLAGHLELDIAGFHRALPDATACWLVLEECRARAAAGGGWWALALAAGGRSTLRGGAPRQPRLPPRLAELPLACERRARVTLHYGDGQAAPARLAVVPRVLFESGRRGYLEGECVRSGTLKTYRLDRVLRVET